MKVFYNIDCFQHLQTSETKACVGLPSLQDGYPALH